MVRVKEVGSQTPVEDFEGEWKVCDAGSAAPFLAVGYFFGRELQEQLKVPIGLIDDSWGGSSCEAWIRRDRMEGNPEYDGLLKKWDESVKSFDEAKWKAELAEWRKRCKSAKGWEAGPGWQAGSDCAGRWGKIGRRICIMLGLNR